MSSATSAAGEDPGVDPRMQRLDASVEHLRKAGHILDVRHRRARLLEHGGGATARDELEAELGESARERHDPGLVVDGDQRAHSSRHHFGSSRCSASCTRSRSVSTVSPASTGTRLARDHGAGVDALVDEVHGRRGLTHAGREHVLERMRAREVAAAARDAR